MSDEAKNTTEETPAYRFHRDDTWVAEMCASEDSRPALALVQILDGVVTAADGFMTAQLSSKHMTNKQPIYVWREHMIAARKRTTKSRPWINVHRADPELTRLPGSTWVLTGEAKPNEPIVLSNVYETEHYPDISSLYKQAGPDASVTINAGLLGKWLKMADQMSANMCVQIRVWDEKEHYIELRAMTDEGEELRGMLMPMMIQGGKQAPFFNEGLKDTKKHT